MALELPALPYAYDALAPYMSKETLEFHHDKHHQAYVTNGNNLLKDSPLEGKRLSKIVRAAYKEKNAGLFNNAGQHYNHLHFWKWMKKGGGGKKLPAKLQKAVDRISAAMTRCGPISSRPARHSSARAGPGSR